MFKKRIQYRYDAVGNRTAMVDPDGRRTTYSYDNQNRISQIRNALDERTTFVYDANGRRTLKQLHWGQRTSYTYDAADNLTRVADVKSDGTTICSFDYTYDKVGNRVAVLEADGSRVTWSYDKTYQLTGEHRTGANAYRHTFAYDPAGNRTLKNEDGQRTSLCLRCGQPARAVRGRLRPDDVHLRRRRQPADRGETLAATARRASGTTRTAPAWCSCPRGVRNTMAYDPDGLRVKLEESTETKRFIWDEQRYLIEADAAGDTQSWYTVEPTPYGRIISKQQQGGQRRFFHFDGLGSTRVITQANENVNNRYTYDAWGNLVASVGTNPNPFRFVGEQGYYTDVETDGIYVRERIYRPPLAFGPQVTLCFQYFTMPMCRIDQHMIADPSGDVPLGTCHVGYFLIWLRDCKVIKGQLSCLGKSRDGAVAQMWTFDTLLPLTAEQNGRSYTLRQAACTKLTIHCQPRTQRLKRPHPDDISHNVNAWVKGTAMMGENRFTSP